MSKISELSNGGALLSTDDLIVVRSGGNVRAQLSSLNGIAIGASTPAAGSFTTLTTTSTAGIGTSSPQEQLHVYTTGHSRVEAESTTGIAAFKATNNQGSYAWYVDNSTDAFHLFDFTDNTQRITVDGDGKMGIGTSNPAAAYGSDTVLEVSGASSPGIVINDTGQAQKYGIHADSNDLKITYGSGALVTFQNDGTVGIGSTNPSLYGKFLVDGTGNLINANASSGAATFQLYESGSGRFGITTLNGSAGAKFTVAGSEAVRIDSSKRVGINRTPSISNSKLEVGGADDVPLINVEASGNTGGLGIGSTGLKFFHGSSAKMTLDSSGRVGINTTTTPLRTLDVKGSVNFSVNTSTHETFIFTTAAANDAKLVMQNASAATTVQLQANGDSYFNGGNVGIGTSSMDGRLKISAPSGNSASADLTLYANNGGGFGGSNVAKSKISSVSDGTAYGANLAFYTNDTSNSYQERMRITSGGTLLIGTTNTGANNASDGAYITADGQIIGRATGIVSYLNRRGSDGQILQFMKDGVSVGSVSTNANSLPSDRAFKTNINDLTLGLDFVASLKPVTYNHKIDDEGSPVMSGLIAQDVEESLNDAGVEKNSMTMLQHEPTDDEQQSDYQIDYLKLIPVLINAIKELKTEVEALKGA